MPRAIGRVPLATGLLLLLTACIESTARPLPMDQGAEPIATRLREADGMEMVFVPGGRFRLGTGEFPAYFTGNLLKGSLKLHVFRDEHPAHTVCLDPYWIDRTEVTVAGFRTFVEATGYSTTAERDGWGRPWRDDEEEEWPRVAGTDWRHPAGPDSESTDDHPVVQVSWHDAVAFCSWVGGTLPTEAQWEAAARGSDRRRFPWGIDFDATLLNACDLRCPVDKWRDEDHDDGFSTTAPVGSFPGGASPFGVLDMAGNVWEWTADWYDEDSYRNSECWNPSGPEFGSLRTMRGGSWYDGEASAWTRCAVRYRNAPWERCQDVGFRCVVPVPGNDEETRCSDGNPPAVVRPVGGCCPGS